MKMTINKDNLKGPRSIAWFLLFTFCSQLIVPSVSYAGGGGPTQPEVQGFTPIGVSDMVDPFTGDFTYNIPLMDIEGYPINISYTGGISMDQEASWVGLGWNLNTGSVVRNMRGLPDDFNGDVVEKTQTQKANTTVGLDLGAGVELFGLEPDGIMGNGGGAINVGLGLSYNNYTGYSTQFSFGPSFNFGKAGSPSGTAGFQLSGSSENGASFSPSLSFDKKIKDGGMKDCKLTSTIGASMNSRAGLSQISYSANISESYTGTSKHAAKGVTNDYSDKASMGAGGSYDLGLHTYSPTVGPSMQSFSVTGKWKTAGTFFAADASYDIGVSYSRQWIPEANRTYTNPAYGYFNLERGQHKDNALMDFNRDNDGSFTKYTPNLPSAHLTYDVFSVNAQGIGGTYRAFRNEVGFVFDPRVSTHSTSGGVGIETGAGNTFDLGVDLSFNVMEASSGGWRDGMNEPAGVVKFENADALLEKFAFQEANEKSVDKDRLFQDQFDGATPSFFPLDGINLAPVLKANLTTILVNNGDAVTDNNRDYRIKRNQLMSFLTVKEVKEGMGISKFPAGSYALTDAPDHHIGEITQMGTDGRRYVFGLPAYNHYQKDVTFSIGKKLNGDAGLEPADYYNGVINYASGGASVTGPGNDYGIDNYFSSTKTPAYAHSFMLTAVLSDDYVDSDNGPGNEGPSANDLGSYVKFSYTEVSDYQWRTPVGPSIAFHNEGMKIDKKDDKASFIHGEKDLLYVSIIETKNYVAVFTFKNRLDAWASAENGTFNSSKTMRCIDKISLYSKPEYLAHVSDLTLATPLQEVHFNYDYSLCVGYPGNAAPINADNQGGKLTLKEIYFTYQNSYKMKRSSYTFEYPNNPNYNMKAVDRWGNYMPTPTLAYGAYNSISNPMNNADFPYTIQNKAQTDINAAAWSLVNINLPSGGRISVEYESDDYAYVQHLPAEQMFPIIGTNMDNILDPGEYQLQNVSSPGEKNSDLFFRLNSASDNISDYVKQGDMIYFRCLVEIRDDSGEPDQGSPTKYEYVSGYAKVSTVPTKTGDIGKIHLESEALKDNVTPEYSPITKAAIQFGRMHLANDIYSPSTGDADGSEQGLLDFVGSMAAAGATFGEYFTGPNLAIYGKERCRRIVANKSWIRLKEPRHQKLGGGIRVKKILMSDNWDYMLRDTDPGTDLHYEYGQEFSYKLEDGTSSGVASYEPMIGGDENPWHQPVTYENKKRLAMDDKLYIEEPIMESQFPSPTVGYSRVTVSDLQRTGVTRTATGKVVKEFYTARDYPTIVRKSSVDMMSANSFLPVLPKYELLTASQGFSIELNDMHGKPKKESIYAQNKTLPISTVEYYYKHSSMMLGSVAANRLTNTVNVIKSDGTSTTAEIGVKYDGTADFRENNMGSYGGSVNINVDGFFAAVFPAVVPTVWPQVDISYNQFRSATMSKVINRFGILEKTVANQDGSIVETNNLAYDYETGEVLATQTTTDFNDKVYSMNYPAYWKYDQVGMAYQNIGYTYGSAVINSNGFITIPPSLNKFTEGDEVVVRHTDGSAPVKGWVYASTQSGVTIINKAGVPIATPNSYGYSSSVKVVRSGRRNKQATSMATLTSLSDPLSSLVSNAYTQVLNAGAVEFSDDWNTYCKCFASGSAMETSNPYVLGTKGNWRPVKSYTHLAGRTQTDYDDNTNIRRDGVFTSYTPYYRMNAGKWVVAGQNWTYVSEVTQYSVNGMTLETRDPLGRYSASQFSFNNTLTTAVAANTRMKQLAFGSFEDKDYTNCMDQNFFSPVSGGVTNAQAHTGRNSILVTVAKPRSFGNTTNECESNAPCTISLVPSDNPLVITIVGGTGPYQLETEIISGSGDAVLNSNGTISISNTGGGVFEIRLCVTDGKGCKTCLNTNGLAAF